MNIAAFFDIDGTLFRNSLLIEHFKKMIKLEFIDISVWTNSAKTAFENWEIRRGDYEEYQIDVSQAYKEALTGISSKNIDFLADLVIDRQWQKTYVYTRERVRHHKEQGHYVFFISGSPDFLVSRMAKKYGVKDFRGSEYIMKEGVFSGELSPMWDSENKKKAIASLIESYDIDMAASYAYGDTTGDITMLESVGHPVAMNPNGKLYRYIKENEPLKSRCSVIVERKDVIYEINV